MKLSNARQDPCYDPRRATIDQEPGLLYTESLSSKSGEGISVIQTAGHFRTRATVALFRLPFSLKDHVLRVCEIVQSGNFGKVEPQKPPEEALLPGPAASSHVIGTSARKPLFEACG